MRHRLLWSEKAPRFSEKSRPRDIIVGFLPAPFAACCLCLFCYAANKSHILGIINSPRKAFADSAISCRNLSGETPPYPKPSSTQRWDDSSHLSRGHQARRKFSKDSRGWFLALGCPTVVSIRLFNFSYGVFPLRRLWAEPSLKLSGVLVSAWYYAQDTSDISKQQARINPFSTIPGCQLSGMRVAQLAPDAEQGLVPVKEILDLR